MTIRPKEFGMSEQSKSQDRKSTKMMAYSAATITIGLATNIIPKSFNPDYEAYRVVFAGWGHNFITNDPLFGLIISGLRRLGINSYESFRCIVLTFFLSVILIGIANIIWTDVGFSWKKAKPSKRRMERYLAGLAPIFYSFALFTITYSNAQVTIRAGLASAFLLLTVLSLSCQRERASARSSTLRTIGICFAFAAILIHKGSLPIALLIISTPGIYLLSQGSRKLFSLLSILLSIPIALMFAYANSNMRADYSDAPLNPTRLVVYLACFSLGLFLFTRSQASGRIEESNIILEFSMAAVLGFYIAYILIYILYKCIFPDNTALFYLGTGEAISRLSYISAILGVPLMASQNTKDILFSWTFVLPSSLFAFNWLFSYLI
jgi:hypothetical protein